ncbi:hypothetical protein MFFC18_05020 [Mariniblastus fucicola]|uniref:Uncharacterized protein n=1 Tax=Mariniblastus fucicola TaxID=980251 RepID=A0A5B9P6L9_9BACT|nr:hypothetical protein MFFC18_05020 [Mariniblastus fucicola]
MILGPGIQWRDLNRMEGVTILAPIAELHTAFMHRNYILQAKADSSLVFVNSQ